MFNGGFTMMPVLIYLFMGWRGAQYARDAHKERAGLRSTRLLHKWIKPPSSDDYVVNYLSRMGGVFLPLLTIFSTTLLSMVGVGQDFLLLKGNEEWGILGFTLVLSVSILLSLVRDTLRCCLCGAGTLPPAIGSRLRAIPLRRAAPFASDTSTTGF